MSILNRCVNAWSVAESWCHTDLEVLPPRNCSCLLSSHPRADHPRYHPWPKHYHLASGSCCGHPLPKSPGHLRAQPMDKKTLMAMVCVHVCEGCVCGGIHGTDLMAPPPRKCSCRLSSHPRADQSRCCPWSTHCRLASASCCASSLPRSMWRLRARPMDKPR